MSYTQSDEKIELALLIDEALETRDVEKVYHIASILKEMNDDESADHFRKMARSWEKEDRAHDQINNN